jgi:hypothetical protein
VTSPTPLTSAERSQLREFVRLVDLMFRSRFFTRVLNENHNLSGEVLPSGEYRVTVPDYDEDDFRSFMTSYRLVGISRQERVFLPKVREVVGRFAGPEDMKDLDAIKQQIEPLLTFRENITERTGAPGENVTLNAHDLLDALVNGELFHADARHEQNLERLRSLPRGAYLWIPLLGIMVRVVMACFGLAHAVRRMGILTMEELPESFRNVQGKESAG